MALEDAVYSKLTNHAGTSALISNRVYPSPLPEGVTLPAATYFRVSATRVHAMGSDVGYATPRVQVDSFATTYDGAQALAVQVRAALSRWSATTAGEEISDSFVANEIDLFEDDREIYRVMQDFIIWHREG